MCRNGCSTLRPSSGQECRADRRVGGGSRNRDQYPRLEYVRRSEFDGFEAAFDFWPGKRIPLRLRSISPKANANQLYTLRLGVPADLRPLPVCRV